MKFVIFVCIVGVVTAANQKPKRTAESRALLKPSGKPLNVETHLPPQSAKPQVAYISGSDQSEQGGGGDAEDDQVANRPYVDYISTPNEVQKPSVEYIPSRPAQTFEYINSYPSYAYNPYNYRPVYNPVQTSYQKSYSVLGQEGYRTGYQSIKPVEAIAQVKYEKPVQSVSPLQWSLPQTYYPLYGGYQYQYYPYHYYHNQYYPTSLAYTYLPLIPIKKK